MRLGTEAFHSSPYRFELSCRQQSSTTDLIDILTGSGYADDAYDGCVVHLSYTSGRADVNCTLQDSRPYGHD